MDTYFIIKKYTEKIVKDWKECRGFAPVFVAEIFESYEFVWLIELTNTLSIWNSKGLNMTKGELILAWTNLGALIEAWLKFFYCVFLEDYDAETIKMKKYGKDIKPKEATFEILKKYSIGKLWDNEEHLEYKWVSKVQDYRNSIHFLKKMNIGDAQEFIEDVNIFRKFIINVTTFLPPIEGYLSFIKNLEREYSPW